MKKLFISTIVLCLFLVESVFSQSTLIQPSLDEIVTTKYGGSEPNLAGRHSSGSATTPTATSNNLGLVTFGGRGYTGTAFTSDRASMLMSADELFTATAHGTRITFNTTLNGTAFQTERMRIDNTGFVGIGTNNPLRRLHISNSPSGVTPNSNANSFFESNGDNYIQVGSPEANENGILFGKPSAGASGGIIYTLANAMNLRTGGNNTRMTITSAGNVGIGTTAPTAKLDIEGDIVVKKTTNTSIGTINALSRSGGSSLFMNGAGTVTVNGIANGVDGMLLYLICGSGTTLVLGNENTSALAGDRIATHTGVNVTITGRGGATLIYESSFSRWRIIGVAL